MQNSGEMYDMLVRSVNCEIQGMEKVLYNDVFAHLLRTINNSTFVKKNDVVANKNGYSII